jgi:hypothetical protein
MWFAAPFNGPRRVISPICCCTSATLGKMRALLPDQLHDHDKQPEVTGGFRASQSIETGRARHMSNTARPMTTAACSDAP